MSKNKKDTIFISYVIPEDKYFATWLASKLKVLGFKVWVEEFNLSAGESFWTEIENTLRNETIRFLPIISTKYLQKVASNSGVKSELSLAKILQKKVEKFIIPIKVEEFDYELLPIEIIDVDAIDFTENWSDGLLSLVDNFREDEISSEHNDSALSFWYKSMKISHDVIAEEQDYFTNWFKIILPTHVYFHYPNVALNQEIKDLPYYGMKLDSIIVSFANQESISKRIGLIADSESLTLEYLLSQENVVLERGVEIRSCRNKMVGLIHRTIEKHLYNLGLQYYRLANKKRIYFVPEHKLSKRVNLKSLGFGSRSLSGKSKNVNWFYGISFNFVSDPEHFIAVNHHLVFKGEDKMFVEDQYKYRRSIPSSWYNLHWLERLLAIMFYISDGETWIDIDLDSDESIKLSSIPLQLVSPVSYKEPE